MPNDKPFIFRKPGESQVQAGDRISRELQEAGDPDDATVDADEQATKQTESEPD